MYKNKFGSVLNYYYLWDMDNKKYTREYLGITITGSNYREILNKEGRSGINFHTKHLKAYLKGKEIFNHGFQKDEKGKIIRSAWGVPLYNTFNVQQKINLVD